ncbi:5-oxoprolinase subunit PxpA [Vibrio scophthalmi]|uniref:5-oxoprolinase subunit PxpA n=1 Tax=Vibrio scophthalmi TaxID=45658 RepID=UPI002FF233B4
MAKRAILLNCDMGESFGAWSMGNDTLVMPHVDMANIACGYHASDPTIMSHTVALAVRHNVKIGAHPSYPDLQGFGRRSLAMSPEEVTAMIIYQVGALKALCEAHNTELSYVKPHGALYNDMLKDLSLFDAVADAVSCFNVPLMTLAVLDNQPLLDIADRYELPLLFEAFADRRYLANGTLAPRTLADAVLTNAEDIISQVRQITQYGKVRTIEGYAIDIEADTLCVHGDNLAAVDIIKQIRTSME